MRIVLRLVIRDFCFFLSAGVMHISSHLLPDHHIPHPNPRPPSPIHGKDKLTSIPSTLRTDQRHPRGQRGPPCPASQSLQTSFPSPGSYAHSADSGHAASSCLAAGFPSETHEARPMAPPGLCTHSRHAPGGTRSWGTERQRRRLGGAQQGDSAASWWKMEV